MPVELWVSKCTITFLPIWIHIQLIGMTNLNLLKIKMRCNPYSEFSNQQCFQGQGLDFKYSVESRTPNPVSNSFPAQSLQLSTVRFWIQGYLLIKVKVIFAIMIITTIPCYCTAFPSNYTLRPLNSNLKCRY